MKRLFVQGIVFLCLFVFAIPVWSLTIDPLEFSTRFTNSGDGAVLEWIQDSLKDPTLGFAKFNTTSSDWSQIGSSTVFTHSLEGEPAYFFVKIGAGGLSSDAPDHFIFKNLGELNLAVIDIASTGFTITNIGKISHIGAIPEPSTLLLLGGGLLGLAVYGRRRMKN